MLENEMERTFGIELETVGISDSKMANALRAVGLETALRGYTHQVLRQWKIVPDASVRGNDGSRGWEAVSPILRGEAGMTEAATAIDALKAMGATCNRTTGVHVHFGIDDLTVGELKTVLRRYAAFEREIDAFMPPSRRGDKNTYCKSIRSFVESRGFRNANSVQELIAAQGGRYFKVNLQSYDRYKTLEFRHHNGIVDADRALYWIRFLSAFIAESVRIGRNPTPVAAPVATPVAAPAAAPVAAPAAQGGRLTASQARLLNYIRHPGGATAEAMASHLGVQVHSARAVVTRIRQAGYNVRVVHRNGVAFYVETGDATPVAAARAARVAPAARATITDSLYAGVDAVIATFYRNRTAVLAIA